VTAPLHGAVVANAIVKVEGNRKSVQHLDGGIIKELRVKEGDRVTAGDVLIVLDDSQARAEFDVLSQQYLVLRATEERLKTELAGGSVLAMSADIKAALAHRRRRLAKPDPSIRKPPCRHRRPAQRDQGEDRAARVADNRR